VESEVAVVREIEPQTKVVAGSEEII